MPSCRYCWIRRVPSGASRRYPSHHHQCEDHAGDRFQFLLGHVQLPPTFFWFDEIWFGKPKLASGAEESQCVLHEL